MNTIRKGLGVIVIALFAVLSLAQNWYNAGSIDALRYNATNYRFGYEVAMDENRAIINAMGSPGFVYMLEAENGEWSVSDTLQSPYTNANYSVALNGNYAVITNGHFRFFKADSSLATVFKFEDDSWNEIATLHPSTTSLTGDSFHVGFDGSTIALSAAPTSDAGGSRLVFVYEKPDEDWVTMTESHIIQPNDIENRNFGRSIDLNGDVIIVGAPTTSIPGSAYIFEKKDGAWSQVKKVQPEDVESEDYFGSDVAIFGDQAVIGSAQDDSLGTNSGVAYVFEKTGDEWIQTAKLASGDGGAGERFGIAVDIREDRILAGAEYSGSGAAYVFEKQGTWSQVSKLTASVISRNGRLGISVSLTESAAMAGAFRDSDNGSASGSVFVYDKPATGWADSQEDHKVISPGNTENGLDQFGTTLDIGIDTAVVGARGNDFQGLNSGAAFILTKQERTWAITDTLLASNGVAGEEFGYSVSLQDNLVAVGNPSNDNEVGAVYIYEAAEPKWQEVQILEVTDESVDNGMSFGASLQIWDSFMVVGASSLDYGDSASVGAAYVFRRSGSEWERIAKLSPSDISHVKRFGQVVTMNDTLIAVGAPKDNEAGTSAGAVYLFERPTTGWQDANETTKIIVNGALANAEFGSSLAFAGADLLVGAPNARSVYLYNKMEDNWIQTQVFSESRESFGHSISARDSVMAIGMGTNSERTKIYTRGEDHWEEVQEILFSSFVDVSDNFDIILGQRQSQTNSSVVRIFGRNFSPMISEQIIDQIAQEQALFSFQISDDAFVDPDGDELTYGVLQSNDEALPAWLEFDQSTLILSGTPGSNDLADLTLKIVVSDGKEGIASDEFELQVNGIPKVAESLPDLFLQEGFGIEQITINGTFTDPEDDDLSYDFSSENPDVATIFYGGNVLSVIEEEISGSTEIVITVTDEFGGEAMESFTVNVNGHPVADNPLSDLLLQESFTTTAVSLEAVFSDPDEDDLLLEAISQDVSVATTTVNGTELILQERATGTTTITINAEDGNGGSASFDFDLTVNASPVLSAPPPDQLLQEGFSSVTMSVESVFSDPDGDELFIDAVSQDERIAMVSMSENMLTVQEVATGTTMVTLEADDGNGGSVSFDFDLTVNANPNLIAPFSDQLLQEGFRLFRLSLDGVFSDPDQHTLTIEAVSQDESIAVVSVSSRQNTITIDEVGTGITTITVNADDHNGGAIGFDFLVRINAHPVVINPISDLLTQEGFTSFDIALHEVFSDPDMDELVLAANSQNENIATVSVDEDVLTISEVNTGTTMIALRADDDIGGTASLDFLLRINAAPVLNNGLDHQVLQEGFTSSEISLESVFSDPDEDELSIEAVSENENIATVEVVEKVLTLNEVSPGATTITLVAEDGIGGSLMHQFDVTIEPMALNVQDGGAELSFSIYPNPSNEWISIDYNGRSGVHARVSLLDLTGKQYLTFEVLWGDGHSERIDVSNLASGSYIVNINSDEKTFVYRLIVSEK